MGRLELICGPMFAGKTTALLARLDEAQQAGCSVATLKPVCDTRYDAACLVSHEGAKREATCITGADTLAASAGETEVVGIDEVHFFDAAFAEACRALADGDRRVIAAGVDFDHRGWMFEAVAALQRCADEVTRLTARCAQCGGVATHTQRLLASDARIAVGGPGDYEPRCADCFEGDPAVS